MVRSGPVTRNLTVQIIRSAFSKLLADICSRLRSIAKIGGEETKLAGC
jgi:hypothetical protein